jgi:hypothetical protein
MSCDPSYLSPPLVFDPDPPPFVGGAVNGALLPGKESGIRSLVYGAEPFFAIAFSIVVAYCNDLGLLSNPIDLILGLAAIILIVLALPCTVASIVFGMNGRETVGRNYANIGLALSLLFCALLVAAFFVSLVSFMMFAGVPPGVPGGRCC